MPKILALRSVDWKQALSILALLIAIVVLWDTWIVYPLKVLVVFFHELSHGLMAYATGGHVVKIGLAQNMSGYCETTGGNAFLIASAGYLGSLVCGGILLSVARRRAWASIATAGLGILLLAVTVWFVRPVADFGFIFGILTALTLLGAGIRLDDRVNVFLLQFIGLTSCLYAVLDIKADTLDRPGAVSDAQTLATFTGIHSNVWGLLWLAISLPLAGYFLIRACRRPTIQATAGKPTSQ
jgi:hypothetical protein